MRLYIQVGIDDLKLYELYHTYRKNEWFRKLIERNGLKIFRLLVLLRKIYIVIDKNGLDRSNESFECNFAICSYSGRIVRNKQQSTFFLRTGFAFRVSR